MISSTKIKVVIDTNVFLSGIFFGGNPQKIINYWIDNKLHLIISPELTSEILNKMTFKFHVSKIFLEEWKNSLEEKCEKVIIKNNLHVCRDEKDNMVLETCELGEAKYLITGDKDLVILKKYKETTIISPSEFIKRDLC